jgi:hypothetical protein
VTVPDLGVLQAVVDAEAERGNPSVLEAGDRPTAQLLRPLDRADVEERFELGPLVAWSPRAPRQWDLVDTVSGARVRGGRSGPAPWRRRRPPHEAQRQRRRLGHLADDPRIGPGVIERRARVHVAGSAVEAFTRLDDLLGRLDDVDAALPAWFVQLFAPERDADGWKSYFREVRRLDEPARRQARWTTRWTEAGWARAVAPTERTWRWLDAAVVHEHALDVVVDVVEGAPVDSLRWLLTSAGAVRCGPFGSDL